MKGLEIAQDFYSHWGKAQLANSFPDLAGKVAVGKIFGSDALGADDDVSKDHDWGPQFTIFLSGADHNKYGEDLAALMNEAAPNTWNGYRLAGAGDKSVKVESVPNWIETWIGFTEKPTQDEDWKFIVRKGRDGGTNRTRESILYFLRHGTLWEDGSGEMSGWREALHYYPAGIWNLRLAEELFLVFHHGEYNFVQRVARRNDPLTTAVCIGEFVSSVMRTLLLLSRDYTPYWKLLAHEFRKLDEAQFYAPLLEELVNANSIERQIEIVLKVCGELHQAMLRNGIITGENDNQHLLPLLNAHLELLSNGASS